LKHDDYLTGVTGSGIDARASFNNPSQTIDKIASIFVVPKDIFPLYAPTHHMMQNSGGV